MLPLIDQSPFYRSGSRGVADYRHGFFAPPREEREREEREEREKRKENLRD
jgi:hypothetical protein